MTSPYRMTALSGPVIIESDNAPKASHFDDIYYHREDGLAESNYTYVHANELPDRWQSFRQNPNASNSASFSSGAFNIGELGFGSGLNFFATLLQWQRFTGEKDAPFWLHYFSCEQYPFEPEAIVSWAKRVLGEHFEPIKSTIQTLAEAMPPRHSGIYAIEFEKIRVRLVLCYGDANILLRELDTRHAKIHAWYLDGFDPKKNPELWQPDLLQCIYNMTENHGSFSTFSAAGSVRRTLQSVGFSVHKRDGFGNKREMLVGKKPETNSDKGRTQLPPWSDYPPANHPQRSILILGAGIAGCSLANKLAKRDWQVTIVESRDEVASQASGNPSALVYPSISLDINKATQLYLHCFHYATIDYEHLNTRVPLIQSRGILFQLENENRHATLKENFIKGSIFETLNVREKIAKKNPLLESFTQKKALYFKKGLTVDARKVCQAYIEHPNIQLHTNFNTVDLANQEGLWKVCNGSQNLRAQVICFCAGSGLSDFPMANYFQLDQVRGQLALIPEQDKLIGLQNSLCFGNYFTPSAKGYHTLGATFDRLGPAATLSEKQTALLPTTESRSALLQDLTKIFPEEIIDTVNKTAILDRVGIRSSSVDHLPVVGPLTSPEAFRQSYREIKRGFPFHYFPEAPSIPNAFIFGGLGAKGFLTAPLLAECLASSLNQDIAPLPFALWQLVHSNRFLIRDLQRS